MRIITFPFRLYTLHSNRGLSVVVLVGTTNLFMLRTWILILRLNVKSAEIVSTLRYLSYDSHEWVPAAAETRFLVSRPVYLTLHETNTANLHSSKSFRDSMTQHPDTYEMHADSKIPSYISMQWFAPCFVSRGSAFE
jgi:hypothetical protein